jgi:non-canonical (house-cleaning) NTP pyrophosphatase
MKFIVGSKSKIKLAATKRALREAGRRACCFSRKAASRVNAQPFGKEEILRGARNRAAEVWLRSRSAYAIGIENGIIRVGRGYVDIAAIVVIGPDGSERVAWSRPIRFPAADVEEARRRGFGKTTAGQILAERVGCSPEDPHAYLTAGRETREELLTEAILGLLKDGLL